MISSFATSMPQAWIEPPLPLRAGASGLANLAPEFPLGRRFVGRYAIDRGHLHTAVELAA